MLFSFIRPIATVSCILCTLMAHADDLRVEANKAQGSSNLQTISLEGDALFELNQAKLSPKGKAALDALLNSNALFPLDRYRIVGHTDHLGSPRINQALSLRRAKAVENYLRTRNINLKLDSIGAGDSRPKVSCSNTLPRPQLIQCLAPNRRVDLERSSGN